MMALGLLASAVAPLGSAEAACRPDEPGPAIEVQVKGLKDRKGQLRIELYPANDQDFLADDTALIAAGKPFRRLVEPTPASGDPELCLRAPASGVYAVVILHDRDGDGRFDLFGDGIAFPGDPRLRLAKPKAAEVAKPVGPGVSRYVATLKYFSGFSFRPVHRPD